MHSPHYHATRLMAESPELFSGDMARPIMINALMSLGFNRNAAQQAADRALNAC